MTPKSIQNRAAEITEATPKRRQTLDAKLVDFNQFLGPGGGGLGPPGRLQVAPEFHFLFLGGPGPPPGDPPGPSLGPPPGLPQGSLGPPQPPSQVPLGRAFSMTLQV